MDDLELFDKVRFLAKEADEGGFLAVASVLHYLASLIIVEDNKEEMEFLQSYSKLKSDSCLQRARERLNAKA